MDRTAYKNQHCREHYDRIYLTIPKGEKDRIRATAAGLECQLMNTCTRWYVTTWQRAAGIYIVRKQRKSDG